MLIILAMLFWFGYRPPLTNVSLLDDPWQNLQIVIGPAFVLGMGQAAYIARMARSACWKSSVKITSAPRAPKV